MTVNGNFTLGPGAVFQVELDATPNNSDKVFVVGGTVNITGATLQVLAQNGAYNPSTDYVIIDNDGNDAVNGTFGSVSTNFAFLTPIVAYDGGDGNDVVLTLLRTVVPPDSGGGSSGGGSGGEPNYLSLCSVAQTRNQCNVAEALDKFPFANSLFLSVLTQTVDGARQAFDALSGEVHATVAGTLVDD
ncbi:MAG: hypothetical protein KDA32_15755, partial [Phycisphaerales bacterium]|nr:hypothetical protein [Phycisphaerales bacterium]